MIKDNFFLLKLENDKLKPVKEKSEYKEKNIEEIFNNNLKSILNIDFLDSQHKIFYDGTYIKLDTLAIDENGCPVIIEYKVKDTENLMSQILKYKSVFAKLIKTQSYRNRILDLIKECKLKIKEEKIDWQNFRILLLSNSISTYNSLIIKHLFLEHNLEIELYCYNYYENSQLLLRKIAIENLEDREKSSENLTKKKHEKYKKDVRDKINENISNLLDDFKTYCLDGLNFNIHYLKHYIAYDKLKGFLYIEPIKKKINIYLKLSYEDVKQEHRKVIQDKTTVGTVPPAKTFCEWSEKTTNEKKDIIKYYIQKAYYKN